MSSFTGLTRIAQLQRWIRAVCNRADVRVEFMDDIPTAYATRTSVVIPRINHAMTTDDEWVLRWQIAHETLGHHNLGPEVFDILEEHKLPTSHPLGAILNIIEDQRIERGISAAYKGDAAVISNGREVSGRRTLEYINKLVSEREPDSMEDDTAKMQAVYLTAGISQAEWCPGVALHLRDEIEQVTSHFSNVTTYMTKLTSNDVVTSIAELQDGYGSFDLAKKVYGLLWDKTEEQVNEEVREMKAKAQEGTGKDKSKAEAGGEPTKLGPDGMPLNEVDPRTGKFKIPFEFFVKSNHSETPEDAIGHGLGLDYTGYEGRAVFKPCPPEQFGVRDYTEQAPSRGGRLRIFGGTFNKLSSTSAFANKMRRYLQVKTAGYYEGGKKKGVLNARSLYKAGLPMVGDGDWNRKVFKQRHIADLLDTSVSLLVDVSGSMSGYKVVHATQACMMLNHVISNVLRVNTEIAAFTFEGSYPMHYFMKKFGCRVSDAQIYEAFDDCAHLMLGNDDADSVLYAYTRLLEQKTKRKVLIVLSDGSPADGMEDTDPFFALRSVVTNITEEKRADIIGIGIMDDSVKHYYPQHVIINKAEDLEDSLIKIITTQILRG